MSLPSSPGPERSITEDRRRTQLNQYRCPAIIRRQACLNNMGSLNKKRSTMRSRACLRWGAVLLAVGLPVAACSSGNTNASSSSSSSGGKSILYATASEEMSDLNPFTGSLQGKTQVLSAIGTPMLYVNQSNQV